MIHPIIAKSPVAAIILSALVCYASAFAGCSRPKEAPVSPTTTTANPSQEAGEHASTAAPPAASGASKQDAGARHAKAARIASANAGAAMLRAGQMDVLILAHGPAYDATQLDLAIAPAVNALRGVDDVEHVWSQSDAGSVRLVVRFGAKRTGLAAEMIVRKLWHQHDPPQLATPTIATIQRGQRVAAALTVIANAGREAGTTLLSDQINPMARKLAPASRVWTAGAVRPYRVVQWMPPYLARHGVGIAEAQRRLRQALGETKKALDPLLKSTPAGHTKGIGPVTLSDLCVTVSGVGEPTRAAFTGKRRVVAAIVEAAGESALSTIGSNITTEIVQKHLRKVKKNTEHFHHALAVMQRYRLTPRASAQAFKMDAFKAQLAILGEASIFHDAFVLAGLDGVPTGVQAHAYDGQLWTLWVAAGAGLRQEQVYQKLAETFPSWRVIPMAAEHDTAIGWLSGSHSTTTVFFASQDSVLLDRTTKELTASLVGERRIDGRKTGPARGKTADAYGITKRLAAQKAGVHAEDLALATRLRLRMIHVGATGGQPVWTGLPTGVMSTRQSELPLATDKGLVPWRRILQLRDESVDTPRLRIDGLPSLWYGAVPHEHAATEFAKAFWTAIEQRVEPSRRLDVRSLVLGQRALSKALRAP